MESLNNLVKLIGNDGLKILYDATVICTSNSEAFNALKKLNKEIGKLSSNLEMVIKSRNEVCNKNKLDTYNTENVNKCYKDVQTDMLGLLHPDGRFVNLHYGKINNIAVATDTLDGAISACKNISSEQLNLEQPSNTFNNDYYTARRGRKRQILRPYTISAENGIKRTQHNIEKPAIDIKSNEKVLQQESSEAMNHNFKVISNFKIEDKKINIVKTLKPGSKICIQRSQLKPLPIESFKQTNDTNFFATPSTCDDSLSVASSNLDVADLADFLSGKSSHLEKYMSATEKKDIPKNNNIMATQYIYRQWKLCDVLDTNGHALIHKAILNNNVSLLKLQCIALKSKKLNVNLPDGENRSTLEIAIVNGCNINIVKTLLDYGASITELNQDTGNNMLHLATLYTKNLDVYKLLVERSNLSAFCHYNNSGYTPLHLAADFSLQKLNVLLSSQYLENFLNLCDITSGKTAIFHAMENNNAEMVRLLLGKGAKINIPTLSGSVLTEIYFDLDISEQLKNEFRQHIKSKTTRLGKRIHTNEENCFSKRFMSVTPPLNSNS